MRNVVINSTFWALITGAIFGGLSNHFDKKGVFESFAAGLCVAALTEIFLIVRQHIPKIAEITFQSNGKLKSTEEFINILLANRSHVDKIKSNIYLRQPFVKEVGLELFDQYINGFKITENGGFRIEGQEMALKLYPAESGLRKTIIARQYEI